jgi:hypothetical protein
MTTTPVRHSTRPRPRGRLLAGLCVLACTLAAAVCAKSAQANTVTVPFSTVQTIGPETFTFSGSAVIAAAGATAATPQDPCSPLLGTAVCTFLRTAGLVTTSNSCPTVALPSDPCRAVVTGLAATATGNLGSSCSAAGASANLTTSGQLTLTTTARLVPPNPIRLLTPSDPCLQLPVFPVTYRLGLSADGVVSGASASLGTPSVDLPPPVLG